MPYGLTLTGIGHPTRRIEDAHGMDLGNDVGAFCNRLAD